MIREKSFSHLWAVLLILTAGLLAYANTWQAAFHFDDYAYILHEAGIRHLTAIGAIFKIYPPRFLSYLSFALNYRLNGTDVFGYHIFNNTIHFLNALLVYAFVWLLFQTPYMRRRTEAPGAQAVALGAALLFAVHPLQTEAVTYLVQRFTSLATFFYLLAVCSYLKGRLPKNKHAWLMAAVVFTVAGMMTKQICFTIPFMVLALEGMFLQEGGFKFSWKAGVPLFLLLLLVPALLRFDFAGIFGRTLPSRSHPGDVLTVWTYALTQARVLWRYLWLFVVPVGQRLDYDFVAARSLVDPEVLLGLAGLAGLWFLLWRRYRSDRLAVFGWVWFFITISITTSIIPIPQVIFEHRCYLPSVGIFLFVSYTLAAGMNHPKKYAAAVGILVFTLIFLTLQRNAVWKSDISLWEDITRKVPEKTRGYNNLGIAYFGAGRYADAVAQFTETVRRNPHAARAYSNMGMAYLAMGKKEEALRAYNKAIDVYYHSRSPLENGVSHDSQWAEMFQNRANLLREEGRFADALRDYKKALALNPDNARAHFNLGLLYEKTEQFSRALAQYGWALKLDPHYCKAYNGMGLAYHALGRYPEAVTYFSQAIACRPGKAVYHYYRSLSYYLEHNLAAAKADLTESIRLGYSPQDPRLKGVFEQILGFSEKSQP